MIGKAFRRHAGMHCLCLSRFMSENRFPLFGEALYARMLSAIEASVVFAAR